jgi:hydrogenase expression/formation protein HypD
VVFFSVGFETTAAPVAAVVADGIPDNMYLYTCHRYVPPAVEALVSLAEDIAGFLLPGHASVITGIQPYHATAERYGKAAAIGGFEPVDILTALLSIIRQIQRETPMVTNCYPRAVRDAGNRKAMDFLNRVFDRTDAEWRGLGVLPGTGLELSSEFAFLDARARFGINQAGSLDEITGCRCPEVLLGKIKPDDCALFAGGCTPAEPKGPCMVSAEGTCRAAFLYPEDVL